MKSISIETIKMLLPEVMLIKNEANREAVCSA